VIVEPVNDRECLDQLTTIAREFARTTLIHQVAARLGSRAAVVRWIQSRPQKDDDGHEAVRVITCDVPQRVRLLADDPNCVERATDAMMLMEALEMTGKERRVPRALATVDKPLRHTGLVEQHDGHWYAVDLFPRRNFDWGDFGKDVLQGTHKYVGKPLLGAYGMGGVADWLGNQEDSWIGRDKKSQEKKAQPSSQAKSGAVGAGAKQNTSTKGGK
jgi:hypothetical protein